MACAAHKPSRRRGCRVVSAILGTGEQLGSGNGRRGGRDGLRRAQSITAAVEL
jgi:hypothetical protein